MKDVLNLLIDAAKARIDGDVRATENCTCGASLDPATRDILTQLWHVGLLLKADELYNLISCLLPSSNGKATKKKVKRLSSEERCILIALIGLIVQIISANVTARKAAKDAVESFKRK